MRIDARKHRNLGDKAATDLFVDKSLLKTRVPLAAAKTGRPIERSLLKRRRYTVNAMNHTDGFKSVHRKSDLACSLRSSFPILAVFDLFFVSAFRRMIAPCIVRRARWFRLELLSCSSNN